MSALSNRIGKSFVISSIFVSAMFVLLIVIILFINSWNAISSIGLALFTLEWNPAANKFGILSMIYGTISVTTIAISIAVPLGIFTAIFTSEVLPPYYRFYVKSMLELLSGIPSIIYGLIGIAFFSIWIENIFDLQSGRTIFTGGLLLAIMILPTIITLTDDALHNVPEKYRETAKGLGLYRYEIVKSVVFPIASGDVVGAILLALGRAFGETMAVMLVIGSIDKIPKPIFNFFVAGQTMTSKLGREIAETAFGSLHFSTMIFMGFLLLVINLLLTTIVHRFFCPGKRLYE